MELQNIDPSALFDKLRKHDACFPAIEWLNGRDLETAFRECQRASWMLWYIQTCARMYQPTAVRACARMVVGVASNVPIRPMEVSDAIHTLLFWLDRNPRVFPIVESPAYPRFTGVYSFDMAPAKLMAALNYLRQASSGAQCLDIVSEYAAEVIALNAGFKDTAPYDNAYAETQWQFADLLRRELLTQHPGLFNPSYPSHPGDLPSSFGHHPDIASPSTFSGSEVSND